MKVATLLLLMWALPCKADGRGPWVGPGPGLLPWPQGTPPVPSLHPHPLTMGRRTPQGAGQLQDCLGYTGLVAVPALSWPPVWPGDGHWVSLSISGHTHEMGSGPQPLPKDQRRRPGTWRPQWGLTQEYLRQWLEPSTPIPGRVTPSMETWSPWRCIGAGAVLAAGNLRGHGSLGARGTCCCQGQ